MCDKSFTTTEFSVVRREPNLDRAMDEALVQVVSHFGLTNQYKPYEIECKLQDVSMILDRMGNVEHVYRFKAWAVKNES